MELICVLLTIFSNLISCDFSEQMPEEEAFAVLVKLMQEYRLRELFKPSMAELGLCMYKLECLIQVGHFFARLFFYIVVEFKRI